MKLPTHKGWMKERSWQHTKARGLITWAGWCVRACAPLRVRVCARVAQKQHTPKPPFGCTRLAVRCDGVSCWEAAMTEPWESSNGWQHLPPSLRESLQHKSRVQSALMVNECSLMSIRICECLVLLQCWILRHYLISIFRTEDHQALQKFVIFQIFAART